MKPAPKLATSASNSALAPAGGKVAPKVSAPGTPPLKSKALPTPSKPVTRPTPAKTPLKTERPESSAKPVTIPELYLFLKRQLFQDEPTKDTDREVVIRNKVVESFKDGFNFEEDIARTRERMTGQFEAARAESKQLQEDSSMQVGILRRKFLEEEGKNQKLQAELIELRKTAKDLSQRLVFAENSLSIERNQSTLLLENMVNVEKEAAIASQALENTLRIIGGLRTPAVPVHPAQHVNGITPHSAVVDQHILDAENAIKNLSDIMKNTNVTEPQEAFQDVGGDLEGEDGNQETEELGESEPAASSLANGADHNDEESNGEYSSDEEVIHVQANGHSDNQAANEAPAN